MSSNLEKVQNIISFCEVTQEHNVFILKKLKELEQSIINDLEVRL